HSSSPQLPERNSNLLLDHLLRSSSSYNNFIFISETHLSKLWFVNFLVSLKPISSGRKNSEKLSGIGNHAV
ncbi:hypothetical protein GIB67_010580, partial [Kingdonia uniflora]